MMCIKQNRYFFLAKSTKNYAKKGPNGKINTFGFVGGKWYATTVLTSNKALSAGYKNEALIDVSTCL